YKQKVLDRFANNMIKDQTLRICMDGSGKIPKCILPSIYEQLDRNGPIRKLTLTVASWMRFLNGTDEQGQAIPIIDPLAEPLSKAAQKGQANPNALLEFTTIFGSLKNSKRFVDELTLLLGMLYEKGARETLIFCTERTI